MQRRRDPFVALARSIIGQQLSVKAAQSIWLRLEDMAGAIEPAPPDHHSTGAAQDREVEARVGVDQEQVGAPADASIVELVEGPVRFVDTRNNFRDGKVYIKPVHTVVGGVAFGKPYNAPFAVR